MYLPPVYSGTALSLVVGSAVGAGGLLGPFRGHRQQTLIGGLKQLADAGSSNIWQPIKGKEACYGQLG